MAIREMSLEDDRTLQIIRLIADADKDQLPKLETFRKLEKEEKDFLLICELYRRCQGPGRLFYVPVYKTEGAEDRKLGATELESYIETYAGIAYSGALIMQVINRLRDSADYKGLLTISSAERIGITLFMSGKKEICPLAEGYLTGLSDSDFGTLLRSEIV